MRCRQSGTHCALRTGTYKYSTVTNPQIFLSSPRATEWDAPVHLRTEGALGQILTSPHEIQPGSGNTAWEGSRTPRTCQRSARRRWRGIVGAVLVVQTGQGWGWDIRGLPPLPHRDWSQLECCCSFDCRYCYSWWQGMSCWHWRWREDQKKNHHPSSACPIGAASSRRFTSWWDTV